jgi:hypothetical protein
LCDEAGEQLREAVKAGELESRGRGPALRIRRGSFDAWLGRRGSPRPGWADRYEVRPDAEQPRVDADRRTLALLREALTEPPLLGLLGDELPGPKQTLSGLIDLLQQGLAQSIASGWREVRAIELVVDDVASEFAGEDALKPFFRADLDWCKQRLCQISEHLRRSGVAVDLRESGATDIEETWLLVRRVEAQTQGGTRSASS